MIDINAIKARLARVEKKWPTTGVLAPGADEFGPKAWSAHGPLRCHATEQGSARGWTQANADADFIAAAPADIAALVAEVERLRGEVSLLQQEARIRRNISDGLAAEVATERAAVVAALRRFEPGPMGLSLVDMASVAASIERGEHRREEGL